MMGRASASAPKCRILLAAAAWLVALASAGVQAQVSDMPASSVKPGSNARVGGATQIGQRQTRTENDIGVTPMARIDNRINNRIQTRLRTRIDRYYDPQYDAAASIEAANQQVRRSVPRR